MTTTQARPHIIDVHRTNQARPFTGAEHLASLQDGRVGRVAGGRVPAELESVHDSVVHLGADTDRG